MKKCLLLIVIICSLLQTRGQDILKPGFTMLESGRFADAAVFFKTYLDHTDSTNKTALICYGRAAGLSGNIPEAKRIFSKLSDRYPGDFEIALNATEALMWNKEYKEAATAYEMLLRQAPGNFSANLGYGNALSSLADFQRALIYMNKALDIQPENMNARVSRKFARLGLADNYMKQQHYDSSIVLLDAILADFPNDKEALFSKAQLMLMKKDYHTAVNINRKIFQLKLDTVTVYERLSYIAFLEKNKKLALRLADTALSYASEDRRLQAGLARVTALGWNEQFRRAFRELDSLESQYPGNVSVAIKRAALLTWDKSFSKSVSLFKESIIKSPASFDANLGTADALYAQELDLESRKYVEATLKYYPGQKDAKDFLERIALRHAPTITTHDYRSSDKGGNVSYNYLLAAEFDIRSPLRLLLSYRSRQARNDNDGTSARNDNYSIGLRWRIKPFWLLTVSASNAVLNGADSSNSHFLTDIASEFKIARWHSLELRYQSDVQNFTVGLINSNLRMNNYIVTYNLNTPFKLGLYTQYYHTGFSDDNSRNLLFASLYYNFKVDPVIKAGINFNTMGFNVQVPEKYFSPSKFHSLELFAAIENLAIPGKRWLYQAFAAAGYQKINSESNQSIYRFNGAFGYRPSKTFEIYIYGLHSNSATSTVVGYTYTELGLKARLILRRLYHFRD